MPPLDLRPKGLRGLWTKFLVKLGRDPRPPEEDEVIPWKIFHPLPNNWLPWLDGKRLTYYAYRKIRRESILRFQVEFESNSYRFQSSCEELARGPGCWIV